MIRETEEKVFKLKDLVSRDSTESCSKLDLEARMRTARSGQIKRAQVKRVNT